MLKVTESVSVQVAKQRILGIRVSDLEAGVAPFSHTLCEQRRLLWRLKQCGLFWGKNEMEWNKGQHCIMTEHRLLHPTDC